MATQIGQLKYSVGFDVKKQDLNALKTQLQQLSNFKISDLMQFNNSDRENAKKALNDIRNEAEHVKDALSAAFNTKLDTINIETFNKSLKQSGSSLQQVYNAFKQGGAAGQNAFRNLVTQVTTTNTQLKETHKFLDNIATTLGNTIKWNIASTAVNALSNSVQQAWGFVKSLDTSLNDIMIVTGKSADEMAKFSEQANEAAKSLGKTTVDYTKAALIYAQQGLSDDEIAARAAITLKTANVTGQSTDQVSEELTSVWNGYKVNAEQAELYIDRLAAVAASTASDLEELSTGMSKVAAAAAAMGVGEDQLAAQLSTIISVTRQAPESVGTALRTVYARISDIKAGIDEDGVDLGRYSGKMAELGFNVLDVNGKLRDMGQVIEEIGGRWQGLTREQQVSLAQTMAGQRQYSNLIALFDNFEEYNRALGIAQNAAGTLQKQQDTYMESTRAHLNQLKAATEQLYMSLVNPDTLEPLIDALASAASMGAKFINSLGGGENLLLSLSGIAVNVFSDQLTKGVQTFVHNFSLGNQQVELMKQNLATFDQVLNIQGLDERSKAITESFKQTELSLAKRATPEQFKQMNNILGSVTASVNEYNETLVETRKLEQQFQEAQKATGTSYKNMYQYLGKTAEQHDKFDEILYSSSIGYERAAAAAEQFSKAVVQQNGSIEVTQNEINALKQALQSISDKDFSISGFERPKQEIDNVLKALQQIQKKDFDDSKYKEFVDKIQKHFQRLKDVTQITTTAIEQQTNNQSQAAKKLERNVSNAGEGLKNIGNQERIRAVGRLVGSFTQLATSVKITANAFNELKNGNIGSGLTALATSLTSVTTAAISAGKAVSALGASIGLASGIGVAIAAISLVVSGLISWKQAADQARQAQIELNNTAIENQHKNQKQIDKKQQLLQAVKDLNEEYENGQITRADLRSEIEKLCDQYGIEEGYIDNLINKYGDLAQGIRQARIEAAKEKQESLQNQFQIAKENVEKVKLKNSYAGLLTNYADSYFADILASNGARFANPEVLQTGGINAGFLELPTDLEDKINLYNDLTTELQKHSSDLLFDILKKWYDDFSAAADEYNQVKEQIDSYLDYDIYSNQYADFDKTKSFEEYRKQREQLINNVVKNDADKIDQVTRAVDKYLKSNYKGLYNQYDEVLNYVDELESRLGKIDGKILESIQELDAAHLDELQRRKVDTWEEFKDTLEQVSQLDLSNVQNLVNANPEALSQIASDRYTFFQSLQDQVKSGKSISSKEIERFANYGASQLQEYFTMMANGQYQMTEDAKEFNEVVNNLKLTGFFDVIDTLQKKAQQLEKFNEYLNKFDNAITGQNDFDYERLNQEAMTSVRKSSQFYVDRNTKRAEAAPSTNRQWVETTFDHDLIKDQLEYLQNFKQIDAETSKNIQNWKELNEVHYADKQMVSDIADAVRRVKDQSETFNDDVNYVNQKLKQTQHQIYKILFPTDVDVKETALSQLSTTLQQLSTESEELSEDLQDNLYVAEQVAEAILRFDDAIQDVVDHYDDWLLALQQETLSLQDQAELFPQLRDAYADMLDIDGSLLSDEFLASTQNLEWMKAAIDGDIQAYDNLAEAARVAALQMLKIDPSIDMSHFEEDLAYLKNYLNNRENFPDLEIGAELNDQKFLEELSNMLNIMGVSAAQASDILRQNLGIDTEIIEVKDTVKQTQQFPVTNAVLEQVQDNGYVTVPVSTGRGFGTQRLNLPHKVFSTKYQPDVETIETTKQGSSFALKVTSANKSAGGHFKYTHASRGAGSIGTARRKAAAEKAAKAAKSNTDTSTKETKKPAEDNRDIYHDINLQLESITRQLNRAQKVQDKLFGKQLIANLNKQSDILEKHKVKLREKQELQKKDLAQKREQLRLLGVIVNEETGNIENYLDALGQKQGAINGLIAQYNSIVGSYNATTDKNAKDVIKDQLTEVERSLKDAETDYKNLETKIKNYDALRKAYEDISDQIEEQIQKQIEINIKRFRMQLEIRLDLGEARRDWNKFKREVLEADNILKDTGFDTIKKNVNQSINDYDSYFNVQNSDSIQTLVDQLTKTKNIIDDIDQNGQNAIYGIDKAQAMQNLQGDLNTLMEYMQNIEGLIQDVDQAILDTVDDISDQAKKQIEDYEFVNDLYQHDMDLLQLLYGDKQYDAMNAYYQKQQQNQLKQIDFLKQYRDLAKNEWDAAVARGQTNLAEKWKQEYMDAVRDINAAIVDSVQLLKNKYTNAVNQIFDSLQRGWTGGRGLQYIDLEWELINKNADEYLDTINAAYAVQQLERKYQKAISDNNTSVKNQRALADLMNEQLDSLRTKEKLTQYDVDRAEKLLQIERARMALEDVKNAKTSLRLKRDSQGNYSYVYSANQDDILAAEQQLAKLQNDLYNFDKDAYNKNLSDILAATKEFQERYKEIILSDRSEEDKIQMLKKLRDEYNQYITNKATENIVIRQNLTKSAFNQFAELYNQDYVAFEQMTDDQINKFLGDLVPGWNGGVQQMTNTFAGPGGFIATCEQAFIDLDTATNNYENQLDELQKVADRDFGELKQGIDDTAASFGELMIKNGELINQMNNEINDINALKNQLESLRAKYEQVYNQAKLAVEQTNEYLEKQKLVAAEEAKVNATYNPPTPSQQAQNLPSAPQTIAPAPVTTNSETAPVLNSSANTVAVEDAGPWKNFTTTVQGIVGNIQYGGIWRQFQENGLLYSHISKIFGNFDEKGVSKDKFKAAATISDGVQALLMALATSPSAPPKNQEYYLSQYDYYEMMKKYRGGAGTSSQRGTSLMPYDTGGYTGAWGSDGRLAILHQKELVLNAQDTKNMLDSVEVLRGIVTNLGGSISARLNGLNGGYVGVTPSQTSDQIDQNVSIQANFPNVNSKKEIEEAFSELVNLAAQRALRRT